MRAILGLVALAIIVILVVAVVAQAGQRAARRRQLFHQVNLQLQQARATISRIDGEIDLQKQAQYVDWAPIEALIDEHNDRTYPTVPKELIR